MSRPAQTKRLTPRTQGELERFPCEGQSGPVVGWAKVRRCVPMTWHPAAYLYVSVRRSRCQFLRFLLQRPRWRPLAMTADGHDGVPCREPASLMLESLPQSVHAPGVNPLAFCRYPSFSSSLSALAHRTRVATIVTFFAILMLLNSQLALMLLKGSLKRLFRKLK